MAYLLLPIWSSILDLNQGHTAYWPFVAELNCVIPLRMKAAAHNQTELMEDKSRGFFSYWHLPGLNPSEPPLDSCREDNIKSSHSRCAFSKIFVPLSTIGWHAHRAPHRLLFTHGFVAYINEADFRLIYLIDLRLVRKPSESCVYSGLPYGARELPALLRQYIV